MTGTPISRAPATVLAFTPVPLARARRDGWSATRQRRFIALLYRTGVVAAAAKRVGMSAKSAYLLRKRAGAESFAAAWDRALDEARLRAFEAAMQVVTQGGVTPRYYRGRFVGTIRGFDYAMLIAALRGSEGIRARQSSRTMRDSDTFKGLFAP